MSQSLELLDYRRRVAEIYRAVRESESDVNAWTDWRKARDDLFATHPQTPLEDPIEFDGLSYYGFDKAWRVEAVLVPGDEETSTVSHSGTGVTRFVKVGVVQFDLFGSVHSLEVLWLDAYGGGFFIPFRDATNGADTYGGGRYLIDTVKGADLGQTEKGLVLDFNYAYHPSCVHSPRWSCPLAPPGNTLPVAVTAGERLTTASGATGNQ